jgi:hypothetical protein
MFDVNLEPTIVKKYVGRIRGSLSGVDTAGAVCPLTISKNAVITQLQINHTLGGTGEFNIEVYSDLARTDLIYSANVESGQTKYHVSQLQLDYENTDSPKVNVIYVKLIPVVGSGHGFHCALFFDKV